ncbi:MAG: hypothetical protein GY862_17435 [Gammaproteobacteria bacterium]|nr:hypothetical protein [Gammaproteobacteria bacterium]
MKYALEERIGDPLLFDVMIHEGHEIWLWILPAVSLMPCICLFMPAFKR